MSDKIKVGGHWKEVTSEFVKIAGHWKPVTKTLLKVNGHWVDASALPPTEPEEYAYHMPPKKVGTSLVLDDAGKYPKQTAALMSANHRACTETEYVELPILNNGGANSYATRYDVASKQFIQIANEHDREATTVENVVNGDFSDGLNGWEGVHRSVLSNVNNQLSCTRTVTGGSIAMSYFSNILDTTKKYNLSFDLISDTGSTNKGVIITNTKLDESDVHYWYNAVIGTNSISVVPTGVTSNVVLNANSDSSTTVWDNISIKEVLPASTTYKMTTAFSQYFTHTKALSQADLDALNANPNLLADVWFNGATLPSGFKKSGMVDYLPAVEGIGDKVYNEKDGSTVTIRNFKPEVRTKYKNMSFGMQNFFLEQDASGRITASHDDKALRGGSDGRYLKIGLGKQLITKPCVTDVKGDTVGQLTETECKP